MGKDREVNRTNSIHFVRYSWIASTQTQSRPAHNDLRENADTVASRIATMLRVTCAKEMSSHRDWCPEGAGFRSREIGIGRLQR